MVEFIARFSVHGENSRVCSAIAMLIFVISVLYLLWVVTGDIMLL